MKQATHWAQIEERGVIWGMRLLLQVYLWFGRTVLQVFLYPVVVYYWLLNRTGRQASRTYLDRLSIYAPHLRLHGSYYWSYRHFISFANAIIDKLAAWSGALSSADVVFFGRERLLQDLAMGRGVVLLGAHLGNLEVCRAVSAFDKEAKLNVLMHTKHTEKFYRMLNRTNADSTMDVLQVTEITAATAQLLQDKIEAGEIVIMTADRIPVNNRQRIEKARFLGQDAWFPQGPFILSGLLKCPVYVLICLRQGDKFNIYFEPFSPGIRFKKSGRDAVLHQLIVDYAARLEHYCLQAPLQWFNFYDFWQDAHDGG